MVLLVILEIVLVLIISTDNWLPINVVKYHYISYKYHYIKTTKS